MGWFSDFFDDVLGFDPNGGGIYGVARDVLGDKIADDILGFDPHGGGSVGFINAVAPAVLAAAVAPSVVSGIQSLMGTAGAGAGAGVTAASLGELGINTTALESAAAAAGMSVPELAQLMTNADLEILSGGISGGVAPGSAGVVGAGTGAGAGIAGLTGGAGAAEITAADLASMASQVDPQALAAYGGDVASNIGGLALPSSAELQALVDQARSEIATGGISGGASGGIAPASGISASNVLRAANTARKLLSNEEEKSKGIDPKLASALGSLVGMGIGGSDDSTAAIPKYSFTRKALPIDTTRRPGSAAQRYFEDTWTKFAAGGGISGLKPNEYKAGGRYLAGPGDGMSDNIKANIDGVQEARLADGEFVIPADVVSHIGNGSSNAGAKKLHKMMARIRKARTGNPKQGKQIKAEKFLPA